MAVLDYHSDDPVTQAARDLDQLRRLDRLLSVAALANGLTSWPTGVLIGMAVDAFSQPAGHRQFHLVWPTDVDGLTSLPICMSVMAGRSWWSARLIGR